MRSDFLNDIRVMVNVIGTASESEEENFDVIKDVL